MKHLTTVTLVKYTCDLCQQSYGRMYSCWMCRKDLCSNHVVFDPRDPGDYPDRYCQRCWDAGEPFREEEKAELDRHEEIMSDILEKWQKAAL